MRRARRLGALLFAAWLAVPGCGDDSGGPDNNNAGDATVAPDAFEQRDAANPGDNPPEPDDPGDDLTGGTAPAAGTCTEHGLDELCRRRELNPAKASEDFVGGDGWSQPETVLFHDPVTGVEILRLTDDPAGNMHHCHINRSTFNADGSLVSFGSPRCWPGHWCPDAYRYIVEPWGRGPRIIDVPGHMLFIGPYEAWDPADPNVLRFVNHDAQNGLYEVAVDDGAFNTTQLLELPHADRRKHIFANVAPQGTLAIKTTNLASEPVYVYVWHPGDPTSVTTFDLSLNIDHPDHDVAEEWHLHDFTHRRNAGDTAVFNYGPQGSSGEPLFFEIALDGSQDYRVSYADNADPYSPVPYYSHPAWNHDGTLVVYNGVREKFVDGTNPDGSPRWTWDDSDWGGFVHQVSAFDPAADYSTSTFVAKVAELSLRLSHYAWDGYDDRWIFGSSSDTGTVSYGLYRLAADGSLTDLLVHTYSRSRCGGSCDYCSLPRPAQSPDGTKALYTSDMLQYEPNRQDLYLAVHRYPFAPVWLGLDALDALRLRWRWHHQLSREVRGVRVLRSDDVSPPVFSDISGVVEGETFTDSDTQLADGESVLYAVTGVEHSGVESRSLSRVIRVTLEGGVYRVDQETPYGTTGFDTTAPAAPTGLTATAEAGGVRLGWTAPADTDVRLFHVYSSPGVAPTVTQALRIASLPASHATYLDWSLSTGSDVHYAVTAVDLQGNESAAATAVVTP